MASAHERGAAAVSVAAARAGLAPGRNVRQAYRVLVSVDRCGAFGEQGACRTVVLCSWYVAVLGRQHELLAYYI